MKLFLPPVMIVAFSNFSAWCSVCRRNVKVKIFGTLEETGEKNEKMTAINFVPRAFPSMERRLELQ